MIIDINYLLAEVGLASDVEERKKASQVI